MALVVAVTGQTNLGLLLVVIEFLVIFGMRQLGRQLQATRPARPTAVPPPLSEVRDFPPAPPPATPSPRSADLRIVKGRRSEPAGSLLLGKRIGQKMRSGGSRALLARRL
jgi:hypothetical protein